MSTYLESQGRLSVNRKSIRSQSSYDSEEDGSDKKKLKKSSDSAFSKWIKSKFASCFGNADQTTDVDQSSRDGSLYESPKRRGNVSWKQAWEKVIEDTFEANDQEMPEYIIDAKNKINQIVESKAFNNRVKQD